MGPMHGAHWPHKSPRKINFFEGWAGYMSIYIDSMRACVLFPWRDVHQRLSGRSRMIQCVFAMSAWDDQKKKAHEMARPQCGSRRALINKKLPNLQMLPSHARRCHARARSETASAPVASPAQRMCEHLQVPHMFPTCSSHAPLQLTKCSSLTGGQLL